MKINQENFRNRLIAYRKMKINQEDDVNKLIVFSKTQRKSRRLQKGVDCN